MHTAEDFPKLLDIFNQYPVHELIIHPRVRAAFYNGDVDMEAFRYAAENSKNPVCFNGNLCNTEQLRVFHEAFFDIEAVMIGRGLIGDPGMLYPGGTQIDTLEHFYDALLEAYLEAFGGARNAMFRLKEHWGMLINRFEDSEKLGKRLRKTTDLEEYKAITREVFHTLKLK